MLRKIFGFSSASVAMLAATITLMHQPACAYQVDAATYTVQVSPGATPADTTTDLRRALAYLAARPDKETQTWTLKFNPGQYILNGQVGIANLKNTILKSASYQPAKLIKMPGWNSNTSGEYMLSLRMAEKVQVIGLVFYGQTDYSAGPMPFWPDQGVYCGSCKDVKFDRNKFYNFGNAALRIVTDSRDPVLGVNSFRSRVTNNVFNNIYQTSTTSTDTIHGGTAQSVWMYNTFVNLRGSVKFASRTPGATQIDFMSNRIRGGDHYGLEIDNYSNFNIKYNVIENIKEYAINIYTAGDATRMSSGFPWGDNFNISRNTIRNVQAAIRYDHRPFFDGFQNIPKNLIIDSNVISQVNAPYRTIPAIWVMGGKVDGLKVTNNKLSEISNKNYFNAISSCTNVTILGNTADGLSINPLPGQFSLILP